MNQGIVKNTLKL